HFKYITINNGYDPDDFAGIVNPPNPPLAMGKEGGISKEGMGEGFKKFTIAFSGSYYRHHHPLYFLKGLKCLIDKYPEIRDKLSVIFVGNFGRDNEYELNRMGLKDVVNIIPYQPYRENLKILSDADALLTTLIPPSDFDGYRIPSKVPEYLYLRKPILAIIPDGELKRLIEDTKAGIVVNPEDTEGIGVAIYDLYKRHKNNSLYIKPDEEVIKGFDYRILSKKMADVLNNSV
ncbi:MAG: glycosyltransferase, partial [Nitrospinae bacterium]|nr:glycosyltransferase [Nitrospinota bacterium]